MVLATSRRVGIATVSAPSRRRLQASTKASIREGDGVDVRANVLSETATHPAASSAMNTTTNGCRKIFADGGRLFHPKLHPFGAGDSGIAGPGIWIGSATSSAVAARPVALMPLRMKRYVWKSAWERLGEPVRWFEEQWDHCRTEPPASGPIRE